MQGGEKLPSEWQRGICVVEENPNTRELPVILAGYVLGGVARGLIVGTVVTVIALIGAIVYLRGRRAATPEGDRLSEEEERALDALLSAREGRE